MKKQHRKTILLVEDDELHQEAIKDFLGEHYDIQPAGSAEEAQRLLNEILPDLILMDINLPGIDGVDMLKKTKKRLPNVPVVMMTAVDHIPTVVECMRIGAFDYLAKPINAEELMVTVPRAFESADMKRELDQRRRIQLDKNKEHQFIGKSRALNKIRKEIQAIGRTAVNVLIEGESGTGKELVAREIHASSPRANKPFVALNCGAISKELIESELFGHKKGAFTSAHKDQIGKFELANHGTLVLDEVSELPLEAQIKLLRVLEEHEFYPVGSSQLKRVDVHIVACSNRDLAAMVQENSFREDLYFRLNVVSILIPPLRERPEDIVTIAEHFIQQYNQRFGKNFKGLSPEARSIMQKHPWKGNGRELRNTIERITIFEDDEFIQPEHLHFIQNHRLVAKASSDPFQLTEDGIDLEEVEKSLLKQALELSKFNKTKAAKLLNLSPPTLYYRLEKYGMK